MISKVKWNNHSILGNLELDFTKLDGTAFNTIVIAGENGVGKTTILETLASFLSLGSMEGFDYIKYNLQNTTYTIKPLSGYEHMGFHTRTKNGDEEIETIRTNRNNNAQKISTDLADIRHYGVAYSKARSGFKTEKIISSTTKQLDEDKYENDANDNFTSIKQLLVDISNQDNAEWMRICKSGNNMSLPIFQQTSKAYRFEKAFNDFFNTVKFKGISNTDPNEIKILFEKNGQDISIDGLSTGEKQIVFRGAHLLKNVNNMSQGIILIDEPELSMHPRWQQKVLQYYQNLFSKNGIQDVQIIIATHSEYVLRSALEDKDNTLVIILTENNGNIGSKNINVPTILPTITAAETNYLAFGILSPDYHIELYGYLQNKIGVDTVAACDRYIASQTTVYNPQIHAKPSSYTRNGHTISYNTLPTYIRNLIDHPNPNYSYTQDELRASIELLIKLCS